LAQADFCYKMGAADVMAAWPETNEWCLKILDERRLSMRDNGLCINTLKPTIAVACCG